GCGGAAPAVAPPSPGGDGRAALGPLGREHAGPLRLLHPRRRHHPAVGPPRPLAAVGPRLRARPRAGPPGRARPLAGVLAAGRPLPAVGTGPRGPDRPGPGGGRGIGPRRRACPRGVVAVLWTVLAGPGVVLQQGAQALVQV